MSKALVLHDYFESAEGGGRLSLELARGLGADIGYGFRAHAHPFFTEPFPGTEHDLGCRTNIPLLRQYRLMHSFSRRAGFTAGYDAAVYSGSYAPLAATSGGAPRNVLYCHTPPRFLYDEKNEFASMAPRGTRWLLDLFVRTLRPKYEAAARSMDAVVANSENVRARIRKHLGLDAVVVHPPCDTASFRWKGQEDFYLSFGRLDRLKRVDRIVEAFAAMPDKKLVVASSGPLLETLRERAERLPNVTVPGPVDEATLRDLIGRCIATVYVPMDEDFGMSPVESMAAGKPVIGVDEGGLKETVVHGETGLLIPSRCTPDDIADAVRDLAPAKAASMREACQARAAHFDVKRFIEAMRPIVFGAGTP